MPEKPKNTLSLKQTIQMRRNYIGKSCKLHFDVAPLKISQASRQYMYDMSGNEYLDCVNSASHVGHCHPHVVSAGQEQMSRLLVCSGYLTDSQVEYAKRLIETLPEDLCVCYFLNSGSEANDLALRMARAYTKNTDVVVIDHAYHGNISTLIDISPSRLKQHGLPKKDWVHVAPAPDVYRGKHREDSADAGALYAKEVKDLITKATQNGRTISAFISESLLTHCGMVTPPKSYMAHVYRYIREAGGLCISDEVQTGLGRTGEYFWGFQSQDVVPDIVTMAKVMGNGFPMGVVVTTKEISDCTKEFSSTLGGSPVACAMAMAVLDVIRNEQLVSSAMCVGKCLMEGFRAIMPTHPMMGDVRGLGLLVGVEIVMDKESRKPAKEAAEILSYKLKEKRILLTNEGPDKNVMSLTPPMCFTCDNARTVVQAFDKALREIEDEASKVGLTSTGSGQINLVPLSILDIPTDVAILDNSEDEDDGGSPSKRPRNSYEGVD